MKLQLNSKKECHIWNIPICGPDEESFKKLKLAFKLNYVE